MSETYIPRLVDSIIEEYLSTFGAVSIEGPKWCGKTMSSSAHAKSRFDVSSPINNFSNRRMAETDSYAVLNGEKPRLIDEWQVVPELWDAIRYTVDSINKPGQFLLSGSSVPNRKGIMHSGAGRISRIRMHTMSLYESGESDGSVSISSLFNGDEFESRTVNGLSINDLSRLIVRGGWPYAVVNKNVNIMAISHEYINAVIEDDSMRAGIEIRNKDKFHALLRSLARNESTTARNLTIANDISSVYGLTLDRETIGNYCQALSNMYLIDNQPPFSLSVRSSLKLKQAEKRHFADPSLACALLDLSPEKLEEDMETMGFMFEALVERDLRIYADYLGGKLYHYQDYNDNEIDSVLELSDGRWGAFEIKLGNNSEDSAAASLIKVRNTIINNGGREPAFLCVICGVSGMAYKRKDGVYSIPINTLKP